MSDAQHIAEGLRQLEGIVVMRQLEEAGYPCGFRRGDLVRARLGVPQNRERDYVVVRPAPNGISIRAVDLPDTVPGEPLLDEDVLRLDVRHSPNHTRQPCTCDLVPLRGEGDSMTSGPLTTRRTRMTEKTHTVVRTAADVTEEVLDIAREVVDGWYAEGRVDWENVWDRMDGGELEDGTFLDLGEDLGSPALSKIKRVLRSERT